MKKQLVVLVAFLIGITAQAQQASTIKYDKQQKQCLVLEYPYPASVVEDGIKEKMASLGIKGSDRKGYLAYENSNLMMIDNTAPVNMIFKVERKSKSDKDQSVVYIITEKVTGPAPSKKENAPTQDLSMTTGNKMFLDSLSRHLLLFNHQVEINNQISVIGSDEKKQKENMDDSLSLEKKIKNLQADLADLKQKQAAHNIKLQQERAKLEALKQKKL